MSYQSLMNLKEVPLVTVSEKGQAGEGLMVNMKLPMTNSSFKRPQIR